MRESAIGAFAGTEHAFYGRGHRARRFTGAHHEDAFVAVEILSRPHELFDGRRGSAAASAAVNIAFASCLRFRFISRKEDPRISSTARSGSQSASTRKSARS